MLESEKKVKENDCQGPFRAPPDALFAWTSAVFGVSAIHLPCVPPGRGDHQFLIMSQQMLREVAWYVSYLVLTVASV